MQETSPPARGAKLGRTRAPSSHCTPGADDHSASCGVSHCSGDTHPSDPADPAARAGRERGGSAPVPAVRGARAVLAPLRRARAALAPIGRARAVPPPLLVRLREVAEARLVVVVVGTAAGAAARAPVGVVHGAAHHLRRHAAALGRVTLEARALVREDVGATVGAPPVAISPGRPAALAAAAAAVAAAAAATLAAVVPAAAAAVPAATAAAVPTCVNFRAMCVCG